MIKKDNVYNNPLEQIVDFKFDEKVAIVFEDMLKRSIPGYALSINLIGLLARKYFITDTNCYDLGSSLGASSLAIFENIKQMKGKVFAVDNSVEMINRSKTYLRSNENVEIVLLNEDILQTTIENASIVVLNYTLQFIPKEKRDLLIQQIYNGLVDGGVLIISEKLYFEQKENELMTNLYYDFKKMNGYSEMEISQKREALENVLIPETLEIHQERIYKMGFSEFYLWFRAFNFASFFAIK
jgi:tRNA (cmo5U34)-methyltransferase